MAGSIDIWAMLSHRGAAGIDDLVLLQIPEGQRLEFKRKSQPDRADLSNDDRKNLGESLSALSNAEGGVILFGVEDERGSDGLDYAKGAQPLQHHEAFAAKVKVLIPEYLSPPNLDIDVMPIALNGGGGVVAIRVGASDHRPHMSMAPSHCKYFLRVQATNQPMVDFQIRDMLRVNTTPRLALGYQLRPGAVSGDTHKSHLVLTLVNTGRVSSHQPYIVVRKGTTLHPVGPGSSQFEQFPLADDTERGFQGSGRLALHPGHEVPAVAFLANVKRSNGEAHLRLDATTTDYVLWRRCPPVVIRVSIGAEDCITRDIEFTIEPSELELMAEHMVDRRRTFHGGRKF
jgi:hypothetical protein